MRVEVRESPIHGKGVFAVEEIPANTPVSFLCWWHPQERWWRVNQNSVSPFINHSFNNNCIALLNEDVEQYIVTTSCTVPADTELTLNYDLFPTGLIKASEYEPPLV